MTQPAHSKDQKVKTSQNNNAQFTRTQQH